MRARLRLDSAAQSQDRKAEAAEQDAMPTTIPNREIALPVLTRSRAVVSADSVTRGQIT